MELQEQLKIVSLRRTDSLVRLTLSPQIVALDQVRKVKRVLVMVCHVADSLIDRMNLVSGKTLERSGTWKRREEDLRRYGKGGFRFMV